MTVVMNIRDDRSVLDEPDVVRIDRATKWGNPYVIGRDGSRTEVIAKYRARLWRGIRAGRIDLDELAALHDRRLACWCAPGTLPRPRAGLRRPLGGAAAAAEGE